MGKADLTVYIVDDDDSVRNALSLMLSVRGYRTAVFRDAESFLGAYQPQWSGALLLDIRMPGMDGLTLLRRLTEKGGRIPVVVITGHGDVESARAAFRSQAVDFLEKPLEQQRLIDAIEEAFARHHSSEHDEKRRLELSSRLAALTPRERQVMSLVVEGRHNREISGLLNISARTVEVHKARVMQKLGVRSIPDLVRLSLGVERASGQH